MKVLLFNGSPNQTGCTFTALQEISTVLNRCGIETQILQIGCKPCTGCSACGGCRSYDGCVFGDDDGLNDILLQCEDADGFVFGSPVYYASPNGTMLSFMDRLFYAGSKHLRHKPAAAIVSARRAGTSAALDALNKYFAINQMPVASSTYWNMVHGSCAEDVAKDLEGLQTIRNLAANLVWLLRCIEAGRQAGIEPPTAERGNRTNFIR